MSTQMDLLSKIGSIGGCKLALLLTIFVMSISLCFAQRVSWFFVPADYLDDREEEEGIYQIDFRISNDGKTLTVAVKQNLEDGGFLHRFEVYRANQGIVYQSPPFLKIGDDNLYNCFASGVSPDGNFIAGTNYLLGSRAFLFSVASQNIIDLTDFVYATRYGWWHREGNDLTLLTAEYVSVYGQYIVGKFSGYRRDEEEQFGRHISGIYYLSPYDIQFIEDSSADLVGLSPDGLICVFSVHVGNSVKRIYRWIPTLNRLTYSFDALSLANNISWRGMTIAGLSTEGRPFRWDASDPLGSTGTITPVSDVGDLVSGISATGRVLMGRSLRTGKAFRWVRYTKDDLPTLDIRADLNQTYRGVLNQYTPSLELGDEASVGLLNQDSRDTRDAQHIIGGGINPTTQQPDLFVLDTCSNPPQLSEFLKTLMLPFASMDGQRVGWKPSTYDQHGKRCADDKGLYAVDFNLPGGPRQDCGMIVVAAHSGYVYYQVLPGYGNLAVVIAEDVSQHSGVHVATLYAHLREKNPSLHGKWVCAGTPIGTVGSTGRGTGPHLHFQICYVRRSSTVVYEAKDVGYNGKIQIVNNPSVLLSGQPVVIPPVRRSQLEPNPRCPNLPRYSYHGGLLYTTAPEIPAPYIDLYGCQRGDAQWSHDPTCCEGNFGDDGDEDLGSHGDWSVDDADVYILLTDLDANGCVDDSDLLSLLFEFGSEGAVTGDINWDLIVDADDLVLLLQDFGLGCE